MDDLEPIGVGRAAHGLLEVEIATDMRVAAVRLDPRLLGEAGDSVWLAEQIKIACNAAAEDLERRMNELSGGVTGSFSADLEELAVGFEAAFDKMATDLARARRRLEDG